MTAREPAMFAQAHDAVSERAAEFFERRRFGSWSDADEAELDAWLAEATLHRVTYLRLEGAVAQTEELARLRPFKRRPDAAAAPGAGPRARRKFLFPLLIAASVALLAAAGVPLADYLMQTPLRSFSTDVGGRTLLRFADGTELELNTDTAVRYRMSNRERTVWLDKGEAWFHVAHDPSDPFTVIVGNHRVSDLGTEFLVRRGADRLEVALLNGGASLSTDGVQSATLRPGDDAIATPASVSVTRKTPQELADKLAWRRGLLVFRNTRLAEVVREFNRYNATKLVIADPSVANVRISTNLRADDYEGFLQLAGYALDLRADREGGEILISRAPAKAKRTKAARAR